MIPYTAHHVTTDDVAAVRMALTSGWVAGCGPYTEALEVKLCIHSGAKYAVVVNSGTAALHLAYLACGVGPGKTVLTSPVSFVATANAALMCGAEVLFWDTDSELDIREHQIIVPVTCGGSPGYVEDIPTVTTIVDACHGPIAHDEHAKATCLSFHPAKHVAAGEGGAVLTNDATVAAKCRLLRSHGRKGGNMVELGMNYRMPDINAALACSQLDRYEWSVTRRREIAAVYDEAFKGCVESVPHSPQSARHLYQVLVNNRGHVKAELAKRGVGTAVHYSPIIPLQPYYRNRFGYKPGMFPNAERYASRTLSIPMYPTLTDNEIQTVVDAVKEVV